MLEAALGVLHLKRVFSLNITARHSQFENTRQSSASVFSAGQSVRSRRILHEAHEEGRPCPLQLTQTKPCPIRPCYTWLLSDWSPCTVEVGRARHTNVMGVSGIFLVTLIVRNINDPESTAS